ncbi:MAG: hypothetical protein ACOC1K_02135 [Nanoarchaeota archaeon]
MAKISFLKVRDVKSPNRAHDFDAGIDLFVPEFSIDFLKDLKEKNKDLFVETEYYLDPGSSTISCMNNSSGTVTLSGSSASVKYDLSDNNDTCIKFDEERAKNYFLLPPHSRVLIPSGLHVKMNNKVTKGADAYALIVFNKSGVSSKQGLDALACVIDYTYEGEIHINVVNTSTKNVRIYEDMKIVQVIEIPIKVSEVEVVDDTIPGLFYDGRIKDRKDGGFGHTDKK